jgi:hypothetical protein
MTESVDETIIVERMKLIRLFYKVPDLGLDRRSLVLNVLLGILRAWNLSHAV